ncbi:zinc finger protein 236 [Topomyia yanbarensis]|uniref:zinc finger protein 236 n=1 Tax=Topomyia yanbarensis TaxID=2498891 RepID=UPI00273CCE8A|nr:zinc finger protein 236 [Topomyia yanbarensis]
MEPEVILIDDDLEQLPRLQPVARPGPSRGRRANKRSSNGTVIRQVQQVQSEPSFSNGSYVYELSLLTESAVPPATTVVPAPAPDQYESVIVDGQDVFIIEELDDGNAPHPIAAPELLSQLQSAFPHANPVFDPVTEVVHPEESGSGTDDYYEVNPLELSDVWNDLITANQEILILLELQDLKHHIVDARQIEDQMRNMACEYCPRILPNIREWNQHIKKMHFQTEQFECDSCDGKFKYFARFRDHLNGHTGQRVYQCDECNHQYAFRIGFLVHKILDHIKLNGIYVCPKCNLDCKNAQTYKLHIATHIDFTPRALNAARGLKHVSSPAVTPLAASRSSQRNNQPALASYSQNNDRNKFLNVFENFSRERRVEYNHLPSNKRKFSRP